MTPEGLSQRPKRGNAAGLMRAAREGLGQGPKKREEPRSFPVPFKPGSYHLRSYLLRSRMAMAFMDKSTIKRTMMPAEVRSVKARMDSEDHT